MPFPITVDPATVAISSANAVVKTVQAGEAISHGQPVYLSGGKYYLADANASEASAAAVGVSLGSAATDGYFALIESGLYDSGATVTKGTVYVVAAVAGDIVPASDLATGDWITVLGIAVDASNISLAINATGYQY